MTKKFIEEQFPIAELSVIGSKEKTTPSNNISGIHVWWARRPTSVVRGLILSCLYDFPENKTERTRINKLIIDACSDFKKLPNRLSFTSELNSLIHGNKSNNKIKLLDAFSGGGAIPLEAARLGLDSYGIDLNPVAVLIGKATSEYIQKFGNSFFEEFKKWWRILKSRLFNTMGFLYSNPKNENDIVSYIWTKQIKCKDSNCKAVIPLLSSLRLVNKDDIKIILKPIIKSNKGFNEIDFMIQKDNEINFNPDDFKIFHKGKVTCPACGMTFTNQEVMESVRRKDFKDRLIVIVEKNTINSEKIYRLATDEDIKKIEKAEEKLQLFKDLIPSEKIPEKEIKWRIQNYGVLNWKDFFNDRQMLFTIHFSEEIKNITKDIEDNYKDRDLIKAIILYLNFILSRSINYNSRFTHWHNSNQIIAQTWSRSGIFMKGSYPEQNPFVDFSGTPSRYLKFIENIIKNNLNFKNTAIITQGNAMKIEYPDDSFDLIITDPPYYDAMLYANPSDFFYIWLKRGLENIFPELFLFPLTPKDEEIIQSRFRHGGDRKKAIKFYEDCLIKVLKEFYRVLKPQGIGVIMYTHKSVVAWEVLINAIIESKLIISAAWPIETEKKGGIRSLNRVVLASSIAIVFKKVEKQKEVYFETQFTNILENELREKLNSLLVDLELFGADFFISAIGFSLNTFTKFNRVISQKTGKQVPVSVFLDLVRKIVNDFLLSTVLDRDVTQNIDDFTNLYIIWCWFFRNNGIDLDDALKLAQSFGVGELNDLRRLKLIKLEKGNFKLLTASDKTRESYLIKNKDKLVTVIDNLHLLAIMWKNNDKDLDKEVKRIETEYSENVWKVGQALAEFFPNNHKEHNYLQGLLARFGKTKSKSDLKKWI